MHCIYMCCTWLLCMLLLFFCSNSSAQEVVSGNQHKSIFREADSLKMVTSDDALTSTMSSKSAVSPADKKEVITPSINSMPMNLIKSNKVKSTPTSNTAIEVSTYRIKDPEEETTCILMTVDALLSFTYRSNIDQMEERDVFVPDSDKLDSLTGDCSDGDKSTLTLKWKTFELNFDFVKTPGGEKWLVNGVQLSFNTNSIVIHSKHPNTDVVARTMERDYLFPTPVGRSFKCEHDVEINLIDERYPDIKVKLFLRKLTVEPFIFKNEGFGPEYFCAASGASTFRSETAPFIFGSLLTVASLFTIAGYAVYRYLRVNKVQYDTME